jgi:hypothetical protein
VIISERRSCDPYKPNAFAVNVMLATQNELQLPPKPVGEKLNGPQRLLSDIITWISNFDKGWTKDVLGIKLQYFCQYGDRKKNQPKNKVKHIYFRHYRIRIDHKV